MQWKLFNSVIHLHFNDFNSIDYQIELKYLSLLCCVKCSSSYIVLYYSEYTYHILLLTTKKNLQIPIFTKLKTKPFSMHFLIQHKICLKNSSEKPWHIRYQMFNICFQHVNCGAGLHLWNPVMRYVTLFCRQPAQKQNKNKCI